MKKLNSYYLISIITLVLMAFIFMRMLQVNQWFEYNNSPSFRLVTDYTGKYQSQDLDADSTWILERAGVQSPWLTVKAGNAEKYRVLLTDFEDDQVLLELFRRDSSAEWIRMDGCELLTEKDDEGVLRAVSSGSQCEMDSESGSYSEIKIVLGNQSISVHISKHVMASDSLLGKESFTFEKELSK